MILRPPRISFPFLSLIMGVRPILCLGTVILVVLIFVVWFLLLRSHGISKRDLLSDRRISYACYFSCGSETVFSMAISEYLIRSENPLVLRPFTIYGWMLS